MRLFERGFSDGLRLILFSGCSLSLLLFMLFSFLSAGIDENKAEILLHPLVEQVKHRFEAHPSAETAQLLSRRFSVDIRFVTGRGGVSAENGAVGFRNGLTAFFPFLEDWLRPFKKQSVRFRFDLPDGTLFITVYPGEIGTHRQFRTGYAVSLVMVFVLMYFFLHRRFAPVKDVYRAVRIINNGGLGHRLDEKRTGRLAREFNAMISNIGNAFQIRERMLNDLGHELKTPLTKMKLELALQPGSEFTDSMNEEIADIESLVSRMLESARSRTGMNRLRCEPVDLGNLVWRLIKKRGAGRIRVFFPAVPVVCEVDPDLFASAVRNLIDNAEKYSRDDASEILVGIVEKDDGIHVQVTDFGIGISREDLPFVLEPFYRADASRCRSTGGFGLGLSICSSIVEAHGGEIRIQSVAGKGTTVSIRIPPAGRNGPAGGRVAARLRQ